MEILVATFIPLTLGLMIAAQTRGLSKYLPAFALGVMLWLFIDASNDALLFDVNSGFSGGGEQIALVGLFAIGLLALIALEYFRPSGKTEEQSDKDSAYLFATLAAVGIGFHALGEGTAFGSLALSTTSSSVIDAMGGYGPGISYALHKFLEGIVIGAVFRAYATDSDESNRNTLGRVMILGVVGSGLTLIGDAVGYYSPVNTSFFFALGAGSTVYIIVRLALPMFRMNECYGRDRVSIVTLFVLLGLLSVYFAGLFHSVAGL